MEAMNEMISLAISLHRIFVALLLLLAILSYIFVSSDKEYRGYSNRVESVAPVS
ncbi:hypothetical protein D1872_334280 [compost metagenome]